MAERLGSLNQYFGLHPTFSSKGIKLIHQQTSVTDNAWLRLSFTIGKKMTCLPLQKKKK